MEPEMTNNTTSSLRSPNGSCFSLENIWIIASVLAAYIFLTPLFVFVLVTGYQRWRERRLSSQLTSSSHIDVFTYNMMVMNLLGTLGTFLLLFGTTAGNVAALTAGYGILCIISTGDMLFHVLTGMERYLAVVHPILYLQLRGSAGVRIRNAIIGCVWLVSLLIMCSSMWFRVPFQTTSLVFLCFMSLAFCFSTVSVLCALFRPGPGEGNRKGVTTDRSKQQAVQTMVIITGCLSLRLIWCLIALLIQNFFDPSGYISCIVGWASAWFFVPSSLVLPLLFLQRVGKLKLCGHKSVKQGESN